MASKRIERKAVRVQMDAVTGKLTSTVLDPLQLAFERCTQAIEGQHKKLAEATGAADAERLARRLREWLVGLLPHTDGPEGTHESRPDEPGVLDRAG